MQRPWEAEATDLKKRIWIARQRDSPFVGTALAGSGVLASSREAAGRCEEIRVKALLRVPCA